MLIEEKEARRQYSFWVALTEKGFHYRGYIDEVGDVWLHIHDLSNNRKYWLPKNLTVVEEL